jgi:proteasome lid subunit RPN8/RPN11
MTKEFIREEVKAGLQSAIATVVFEKVDGTMRQMRCTLMSEHLPEHKETSPVMKRQMAENDEVLAVWDLDAGGWRSFRMDSIKSISFESVK